MEVEIRIRVDGCDHTLTVDTRTTVLDALREQLGITSAKKGCDHGQCGACTVLVDQRRALSCLLLAASRDGAEVVTANGLGVAHPVAEAFLDADAYQCGYCTPGQICAAVGVLAEAAAGHASAATADISDGLDGAPPALDRAEISERMSGNLCRCGAYANIVTAVEQAIR